MCRLMATGPAAHIEYPLDSDLSQMDGCPLARAPIGPPDPGRLDESAVEPSGGRDNLGELDTFAAPPADAPATPADSHWRRLQRGTELAGRWRAICQRVVRQSAGPSRRADG